MPPLDTKASRATSRKSKDQGTVQFLLDIIPSTFLGAFAEGNMLQVLLIALLFAFACSARRARRARARSDRRCRAGSVQNRRLHHAPAPIGAFGAMAFTIGKYGLGSLVVSRRSWAAFMSPVWFSFSSARRDRAFLRVFDPEVPPLHQGGAFDRARHVVVGERAAAHDDQDGARGRRKDVVGLVIPAGYSFNLDGRAST